MTAASSSSSGPISIQEAFKCVTRWYKANIGLVQESGANAFTKKRAPEVIEVLTESLSELEMRAVLNEIVSDWGILAWARTASDGSHSMEEYARAGLKASGEPTFTEVEKSKIKRTSLGRSLGIGHHKSFKDENADGHRRFDSQKNLAGANEEVPISEMEVDDPLWSNFYFFGVNDAEHLTVNREVWEDTRIERVHDKRPPRNCSFYGSSIPKVAPLLFVDFVRFLNKIEIWLPDAKKDPDDWEFAYIEVDLGRASKQGIEVVFLLEYDVEFWAKRYSISDLANAMEEIVARHRSGFRYWQRDKNTSIEGFGVSILTPLRTTVEDALGKREELKQIASRVRAELNDKDAAAVNVIFDFPPVIKNACEQYLLYFLQFLSDLGIEANAEIKEQASRVLFSVTPVDGKEALSKIREALEVYLRLPQAPGFEKTASQPQEVAVAQLRANVLHLQSQIVLAKAVIDAKNAALEAKDAHIALLGERIDLKAYQPQLKEPETSKEELVRGVLSVKKYDYKFLEIDFPELLRKLKRRLK